MQNSNASKHSSHCVGYHHYRQRFTCSRLNKRSQHVVQNTFIPPRIHPSEPRKLRKQKYRNGRKYHSIGHFESLISIESVSCACVLGFQTFLRLSNKCLYTARGELTPHGGKIHDDELWRRCQECLEFIHVGNLLDHLVVFAAFCFEKCTHECKNANFMFSSLE
jgi:hypothetical protein